MHYHTQGPCCHVVILPIMNKSPLAISNMLMNMCGDGSVYVADVIPITSQCIMFEITYYQSIAAISGFSTSEHVPNIFTINYFRCL